MVDSKKGGLTEEEVSKLVISMLNKQNVNSQKSKGSPQKKDLSKVGCYYCINLGHYANNCSTKRNDKEKGIWRPTVFDREMTKDEFFKLKSDHKNKGKKLVEEKFPQLRRQSRQSSDTAAAVNSVFDNGAWAAYLSQEN